MDVIGNNIANVNTEAFKSSRVTFTEIMYQTTSSASGGNAATGVGGINAKQIGLGVATGETTISITTAGAAETTGNPFDLKLTDSESTNFFIVSDGTNTFFTRSGSYYVDGNGFLCMTSTGYTLMGWQVDPQTGEIKKDIVTPLQVMSAANQTSAPEATTLGAVSGILDKNDANVTSDDGYAMTLNFYDDLGYSYTAKFAVIFLFYLACILLYAVPSFIIDCLVSDMKDVVWEAIWKNLLIVFCNMIINVAITVFFTTMMRSIIGAIMPFCASEFLTVGGTLWLEILSVDNPDVFEIVQAVPCIKAMMLSAEIAPTDIGMSCAITAGMVVPLVLSGYLSFRRANLN
jgi:hypothetical protein